MELQRKFHLMSFSADEVSLQEDERYDHLGNTYDAYRRVDELRKSLTQYDTLNPCFGYM